MTFAPVTVVVDGRLIAGSRNAQLSHGTVAAPLDPYARAFATAIARNERGRITFERDGRILVISLGSRAAMAGSCGGLAGSCDALVESCDAHTEPGDGLVGACAAHAGSCDALGGSCAAHAGLSEVLGGSCETRAASRDVFVGATAVRLPIAPYLRAGEPIIPLAAVARALGADVTYEPTTHTIDIETRASPLATPTPFATWSPPPGELPTFTPHEIPTPAPTVSGIPEPRRTPILVPPPEPEPTAHRTGSRPLRAGRSRRSRRAVLLRVVRIAHAAQL